MAHRNIDISRIIPEEFKDTPFAKDMAAVMQSVIVEPFINNLNQLMLSRQPGDDVQVETIKVVNPNFEFKLKDPFARGTLLVMERGIKLFQEATPTGTTNIDNMVDAITGDVNGTVNHELRTVTMALNDASPSNPLDVEIVYLTKYSMDAGTLDSLRQSLGLFIDTTGLTTDEDSRRLVESLPHYYETSHSKRFVQFLGYTANVLFTMKELYARMNKYPDYGDKYTLDQVNELGFTQWAHELEAPKICACVITQTTLANAYGGPRTGLESPNAPEILEDGRVIKIEAPGAAAATLARQNGQSIPFSALHSAHTMSTTAWDSSHDIVAVEVGIQAYTNNPSPSIEEQEIFEFGFYITDDTRRVQRVVLQHFEQGGMRLMTEAQRVVGGNADNADIPYIWDTTEIFGYHLDEGDTIGLGLHKSANQVTVFIKKYDSQTVQTFGPFQQTAILNGEFRFGFTAEFSSNSITASFRTDAQIDPCATQLDLLKMQLPYTLSYRDWCNNRIGPYSDIPNSVWYKTSFVALEYDDEKFFENVPDHVNLFEKITQLFYQLAPIQLVLDAIVARRSRKHLFKLYSGYSQVEKQSVKTDPTTVTGVTPL